MDKQRNGYTFMKQWFDFAYQNPDKVTPNHAALYFWLIQLNNSLDWKLKFGVPTVHAMEVLGIKSFKTYRKAFDDLKNWNFIQLVTKSTNQYTANVVALVKFTQANTQANTKAIPKQGDVVKPIQTGKPIQTPQTGAGDLLNIFLKVFNSYDIVNESKELKDANTLLEWFDSKHPGKTNEELLNIAEEFFIECSNIKDNWLRENMSLSFIINRWNRIKKAISKHVLTDADFEDGLKPGDKIPIEEDTNYDIP